MAVSKRTRYEVLARDNNTCRYCHATDTPLTIDHVTPVALGGTDDPSNLVAACRDCNYGKASSNPDAATVAQVSNDAVRWAEAMKLAADRMAANKAAVAEELKPWFDEWWMRSGPEWSYKLPADAAEILSKYLAAGMPLDALRHAARIALRKRGADNYWHYFQGVANNLLRDLQRDAAAILAVPAEPEQDATLGWGNRAWRKGYLKALEHIQRGESGDLVYRDACPVSAYQYGALSMVVDAEAMNWMASV